MDSRISNTSRRDRLKGGAAVPMHPRAPTISTGSHCGEAISPLAVKPKAACRMLSCGITRLYELLNEGELTSYLDGRSRLITTESIRAYVERKVAASETAAPRAA